MILHDSFRNNLIINNNRNKNVMYRMVILLMTLCLGIACGGCDPSRENMVRSGRADKEGKSRGIAVSSDPEASLLHLKESDMLILNLSEGSEDAKTVERPPSADPKPISDEDVEKLLARLPELKDPHDGRELSLPPDTRPAPRAGKEITDTFPPPADKAPPSHIPDQPLEVTRFAPEGNVPLAPHFSITFNQPMIAVTSHDVAASDIPVRLTPEIEGKWRWIGTRTLIFETETRLPMATKYEAHIPSGTRSVTGAMLEKEFRAQFETPPPSIKSFWPASGQVQARDTIGVIVFDQDIDQDTVLDILKVSADGRRHPIVKATKEDIEKFPEAASFIERAMKKRWVAFRPEKPWPYNSSINIVVPAGTPSAEGPELTAKDESRSFRTFGPFKVTRYHCPGQCNPGMSWHIQTSNPIDFESLNESEHIQIEPELPLTRVSGHLNNMNIRGMHRANTKYRVRLSEGIKDIFGQPLEKSEDMVFSVGPVQPRFTSYPGPVYVLDPAGAPVYKVHSQGYKYFRVKAYAVEPEDWADYNEWLHDTSGRHPGKRVFNRRINVSGDPEEMSSTGINIAEALEDDSGHVVLEIEGFPKSKRGWGPDKFRTWLQRTRIGLMAWHAESLDVLAMDLEGGKPLAGVELSLYDREGKIISDRNMTSAEGHGSIALDDKPGIFLVARHGHDSALLAYSDGRFHHARQGWTRIVSQDRIVWYVADDRGIYRPGERVHFKAWLRVAKGGPLGDLEKAEKGVRKVKWRAIDPRGSVFGEGSAEPDYHGGISFHLDIPEDVNLGNANIVLEVDEGDLSSTRRHSFQIQEFRRPEFEVSARGSEAPHFQGESLSATVSANYYTGEPLSGAEVNWTVTSGQAYFRPPGHNRFSFGRVVSRFGWSMPGRPESDSSSSSRMSGLTGADGEHILDIGISGGPPFPMSLKAEASVMDVNRQAWAASAPFLVHPASIYVGLATEKRFIANKEDLKIEIITADLDGEISAGRPVSVIAQRMEWKRQGNRWEEKPAETRTCEIVSEDEAVSCVFESLKGGRWLLKATVRDKENRASATEIIIWVSGGPPPPRVARVEQENINLIPDKDEYKPGEVAGVLAQLPFYPADIVVTQRREGVLHKEHIHVEGPDHTINLPIRDTMTPGVHLHVAIAGTSSRIDKDGNPDSALPARPAFGYGSIYLPVPPVERTLKVEAKPLKKELEPGGSTSIRVRVRDAEDRPLENAQVLLVVADEAVLALTGYRLPNPLNVFYFRRVEGVIDRSLYPNILLADLSAELGDLPDSGEDMEAFALDAAEPMQRGLAAPMARSRSALMSAEKMAPGAPGAAAPSPIAMREDLNPLALFEPAALTGSNGEVEVEINLPDNLTRYRIMAVAVDGKRLFGSGESTITARLPLMVRPSLPRFLNLGDEVKLPFLVQNRTDEDLEVDLAVRSAGLNLNGARGYRFKVPPKDRVELLMPAESGRVGTARVQVAISADQWSDAAEISLPVWTPVTSEAFAVYGTVDEGAIRQPVEAPDNVRTDFGGLEITTSSTELQALTDAVLYLSNYPFDCTEQIASRVLAISALVDVLEAFEAEGLPPPVELKEAVARDLKTIATRQNRDGSFGLWRRGRHGDAHWPYLTVHVTLALILAQEKGFEVDNNTLRLSMRYLMSIERYIPAWYSEQSKWSIRAAALYVLNRAGNNHGDKARALLSEGGVDNLNIEALGWILAVLASDAKKSRSQIAAIERSLLNRVTETAATASFSTSYGDGAHLLFHSSRRTDAIVIEGLMAAGIQNELVVKTVRGLLAHRKQGRWGNTQENSWVLLALDGYFRRFEGVSPDFVSGIWLGERFAGEHRFRGRSTERYNVSVPMEWLAEHEGHQDLILSRDGKGRMYYRIGLRYVPYDLAPPPAEHGFTVERTYEAVDDPDDVRRDDDGTWRVKAGAPVRVRLTLVAPSRRYHVALVDRLPAGFEPMNPALAVTGSVPPDPSGAGVPQGRFWFWLRTWYEHQNLRDERAEAFASLLWSGVHNYTYVARATTPGRFIAPPPTVEEMYHPETFGRGSGEIVIVE